MNYAEIKPLDVSNAKGISCTMFVSGCYNNCKNCHNLELQDFNYGQKWTQDVEDFFIFECNNHHVAVVSILGGEPMQQDNEIMLNLFKRIKNEVNKPLWVWTGLLYEDLLKDKNKLELLKYIDVLIDGRFIEELKDLKLKYRGSSNQRIIDVQESIKQNKAVLYEN